MQFYCCLGETNWNGIPPAPGPLAVVSPAYGRSTITRRENRVTVPPKTSVIQDSGAFCDGPGQRLSFEAALDRQIEHAERWGYANRVTHRASYDLLIDEKWDDSGARHKARWTTNEAEEAINQTVQAAEFLTRRKAGPVVLSAQGVDAAQYLRCVERITGMLDAGDILGLGGWCIVGKLPRQMLPIFRQTIRRVVPFAASRGVQRIHIWGMIFPIALGELLWICDQHEIALSTDSAGPSLRPCMGVWGYGNWYKKIQPPPLSERGEARAKHVAETRAWLENLRATQYYRPPYEAPQLRFW